MTTFCTCMRIGGFKAEVTLPLEVRKTWHSKKAMECSKAANKSLAKRLGSTRDKNTASSLSKEAIRMQAIVERYSLPTLNIDNITIQCSVHTWKRRPKMASASASTRYLMFRCVEITVGTCKLLGVGHSVCLKLPPTKSAHLDNSNDYCTLCGDDSQVLHLCDGKECNRVFLKLQMPVSFFSSRIILAY
jgi:hypothetical protein